MNQVADTVMISREEYDALVQQRDDHDRNYEDKAAGMLERQQRRIAELEAQREGMVLVPMETTEEIREVIRNEHGAYGSEDELYSALIAAATKEFSRWGNKYARLRDELAANLQERVRLQATGDKVSRHYACPDCAALRAKLRANKNQPVKEQWAQPELAAAQAREATLRGYLLAVPEEHLCLPVQQALSLPTDDSAMREALRQAKVEVLREAADEIDEREGNVHLQLRRMADELAKVKP